MAQKIVLTGGPCGGKTTALSKLAERLEGFGYRVLCVPEAATMLFKGGLSFEGVGSSQVMLLQKTMLETNLRLEQTFEDMAQAYPDKTVILCDRGANDVKAFCDPVIWEAILDMCDVTEGALMSRYEAVIHMVTAAIGAEEHYTLDNNSARTETPEQAANVDRALQDAWTGHAHMRVVDNTTDFEEKVRKTVSHICRVLGVPEPVENERRFLVQFDPSHPLISNREVHWVPAKIAQDYILSTSPGIESRVRSRECLNHRSYTNTTKLRRPDGSAIEKEERISPPEYVSLLASRDPNRATVHKQRMCFVWEGQYVELDIFRDLTLQVLEIEVPEMDTEVVLPPFVKVIKEVTGDSHYSNYALAKHIKDGTTPA